MLVCVGECVEKKNTLKLTSLTGDMYVCSLGSLDHSHCSILYVAWFRASGMLCILDVSGTLDVHSDVRTFGDEDLNLVIWRVV